MTAKRASTQEKRAPRPNKRVAAKSRTRQKVLDSAKRLFAEKGYESTTIRGIAAEARMSTGAVFASFTGKSDVFGAIILADRNASYEVMEGVLDHKLDHSGTSVDKVLVSMFEEGYRFRLGDLPLMMATISASWSPEMGADVRELMAQWPVTTLIERALAHSVSRGEIDKDADLPLLSRMLWQSYVGNYAHAVYDAWPLERILVQMSRQVEVVLASARTAAKPK